MTRISHPFDRYAGLTDVDALKAISDKPLRKSVRVNTLKMDVEEFVKRAKAKEWQLTPVPWCDDAFYLDRENREKAIGKDLLHLLGHFYMQEAASMLPVALLQPQPGETILDMSAAPGSKTTQVAARMKGSGVIVANDVQENRLWTLKSAIYRLGVTNVLVTKKVGQWFGKHMTERFDRVLCDAPCTAEGTSRKDSDALRYCSPENVKKMSTLQLQLLEAAVHACKVGGRIVYSTCTLTPEENEGTVLKMLEKFPTQLRVLDPRELRVSSHESRKLLEPAIQDSLIVQRSLQAQDSELSTQDLPLLRLWPQTYDTEGFFSAVLEKVAPTRDVLPMDSVRFQEEELPKARQKDIGQTVASDYGDTLFDDEAERLFLRADQLMLTTLDISKFRLPVQNYSLGLPFGKKLSDGRILLSHELTTLRGMRATGQVLDVSEDELQKLLSGQDIPCPATLRGHMIVRHDGIAVGHGLAKDGKLKNNLPRWIVQHG
jgi:16S rRNA (cytosine1407-C5)-methyltransferase